jgi:hypothetical protein
VANSVINRRADTLGSPLGARLDRLTAALQEVEDILDEAQFRVPAEVPLGPDHRLRWGKSGSDWALFVVTKNDQVHDLIRAARTLRVAAVASLDALYSALKAADVEEMRAVSRATEEALSFVARVRVERTSLQVSPGQEKP